MSYFSEKFNQLRKDKDLTQEQIADIFHVSPQSVSRWETGANYPDIELLPHLAIYFKVTLDELLGMKEILKEEKANEYVRDIQNLLNSGKVQKALDTARKAMKEYPLNGDIDWEFTLALWNASKIEGEEGKKYKSELMEMAEKSINNLEPHPRCGHKVNLVRQYAEWGMIEQAKKVLETLPSEIWDTQEPWSGLVLEGREWQNNQGFRIGRFTMLLTYAINGYADKADLDVLKKIEWRKRVTEIERMVFVDEGNLLPVFENRVFQNIVIAELYCETGDIENALNYVENGTKDAIYFHNNMESNMDCGYSIRSTPRNLPWVLWEDHLMKPAFDIVRTHERFIKCFKLLKDNSRELK
ncbi:MAG: helix-turn-helix domain-containing protein [Oscillospiraceae bacterium]|nr:helix-turn-helix domain-containing protein [Oscillospiraceae bacterium]